MTINEALNIIQENSSSEQRRNAFEFIIESKIYNEDIIHLLASGLVDEYRGVRDICSRGLSLIPSEYAHYVAFMVVPLIAHNDIEIRNLAGDLLLNLKDKSVDALLPFFENASEDVRKYACDIVGIVGNLSNLSNIYPLLNDTDINVRNSGIEAIGNIVIRNDNDVFLIQEALDKLILAYNNDADSQVNIIDAIGKFGSAEAEDFLIDIIHNTDDEFLKIATIDSLSINGNSKELCIKLIEELPSSSPEMQVVILKTIYAILYRIDELIELPDELRFVAHNALFDDDADIRGAGLVALGVGFRPEDCPALVNELMFGNPGTSQHILYNLLSQAPIETVEEFFLLYQQKIRQKNALGIEIDMLGVLSSVVEGAEPDNLVKAFEIIIETTLDYSGQEGDILSLLFSMNKFATADAVSFVYSNSSIERKELLNETIKIAELEDLYGFIE